ncbi:hypothetical protein KBD33_01715 [Candidatus Gracilibacteria bacterium]|nr:hypothetical protein [Candidatus Gracilibacteria bacterium]
MTITGEVYRYFLLSTILSKKYQINICQKNAKKLYRRKYQTTLIQKYLSSRELFALNILKLIVASAKDAIESVKKGLNQSSEDNV